MTDKPKPADTRVSARGVQPIQLHNAIVVLGDAYGAALADLDAQVQLARAENAALRGMLAEAEAHAKELQKRNLDRSALNVVAGLAEGRIITARVAQQFAAGATPAEVVRGLEALYLGGHADAEPGAATGPLGEGPEGRAGVRGRDTQEQEAPRKEEGARRASMGEAEREAVRAGPGPRRLGDDARDDGR
jgi:hypothetical protein